MSDGASLWADNFDIRDTDVFLLQDTVAQQVITRLHLQLDPSQQATLHKQYTSSSAAYDFYIKGIYSLDQRGYGIDSKPQMEGTIELFRKAIEVDPNYALAHAQLAYAYTWTALFIDTTTNKWYEFAKQEIVRSQEIDPDLAESHVAKGLLLWSGYEGYQNEAAMRELLIAKSINPAAGHADLSAMSQHLGLDDLAEREANYLMEIDPTGQNNNDLIIVLRYLRGEANEWYTAFERVHPGKPPGSWYHLRTGQLVEAERDLTEGLARDPRDIELLGDQGILLALKGDFDGAKAVLPKIAGSIEPLNPSRHHETYSLACICALVGDAGNATKWLRETANTGFPNYPLFERDHYLDRVRQSPEFAQFMSEQKAQWKRFRQEFDNQ